MPALDVRQEINKRAVRELQYGLTTGRFAVPPAWYGGLPVLKRDKKKNELELADCLQAVRAILNSLSRTAKYYMIEKRAIVYPPNLGTISVQNAHLKMAIIIAGY